MVSSSPVFGLSRASKDIDGENKIETVEAFRDKEDGYDELEDWPDIFDRSRQHHKYAIQPVEFVLATFRSLLITN